MSTNSYLQRITAEKALGFFAGRGMRSFGDTETRDLVAGIIADVCARGDAALLEYTSKFDHVELTRETMRVRDEEFAAARKRVENTPLGNALRHAYARIYDFHSRQREESWIAHGPGSLLGQIVTPIEASGLYVPGGKAPYPSTVLMNAIPARIAGVSRRVICSPAGKISDAVLYAAELCDVHEIWKIGGAQAIAALAFGTESIQPVAKITGPGNRFVTEAKRQVYGLVSIDMLAGPSEIMIYADDSCDPDFVARDLLSQAEHDEDAPCILVSESSGLIDEVERLLAEYVPKESRRDTIEKSLRDNSCAVFVQSAAEAYDLINAFAAEHLEILAARPLEEVMTSVRNAGAIFYGKYAPEPLGDYIAGPNHTLPTMGSARFASPLGVYDFIKRSSLISFDQKAFSEIAADAALIARDEGFSAHEASVMARMRQEKK
jgi:histidinol dehydrogenase